MSGRVLLVGAAEAEAIVLDEPLSMWGGLDPHTGEVIDRRHPQSGTIVTGSILVMPFGRGSSSSSSVLAEAIRLGTAPAAIVLREPDDIVLLGAVVAEELYGIACPIVVVDAGTHGRFRTGDRLRVDASGVTSSGRE